MTLPASSAELALVVIDDDTSCLDFPLPRQFLCHPCCWYLEDPRRKKERAPCSQPWRRRPAKKIICYKGPLEWLNDQRLAARTSTQRSRLDAAAAASAADVVPSSTSLPTKSDIDEPAFRLLSGLPAGDVVVTIAANDNDFRLKKVATSMQSSAPTGMELVYERAPSPLPSDSTNASADAPVPAAAADAAVEPAHESERWEELGDACEEALRFTSEATTSELSHSPVTVLPPPSPVRLRGCVTSATAPPSLPVATQLRLEVPSSTQFQNVPVPVPTRSLPLKKRKAWVAPERTRSSPSHDPALPSKPPSPNHADACGATAPPTTFATTAFVPIDARKRLRTAPKAMIPPESRESSALQQSSGAPSGLSQQRLEATSHSQATTTREIPSTTHAGRATGEALRRNAVNKSAAARTCHLSSNRTHQEETTDTVNARLELEQSGSKRGSMREAPHDFGTAQPLARRDQLPVGSLLPTSGNTTPCLLPANPHHEKECAMGGSDFRADPSHPGRAMWENLNYSQQRRLEMELSDEDEDENGAFLTTASITYPFEPMPLYSPLRRPVFKRARQSDGAIDTLESSLSIMPTPAGAAVVPPSEALREINLINTRPAASSGCGSISPLERVVCGNTMSNEVPAPTTTITTANASASKQQNPTSISVPEASGNSSPDSSTDDQGRSWKDYLKDWVKW